MVGSGVRTFFTVWAGQLVSQVGSSMTGFALTIYVFQDTGSVTRLAMVLLSVRLPAILLGPVAGVWIDRLDRRIVMLVSDAVAGAVAAGLAVLLWSDLLRYWHILVLGAVASAAGSFQEPAYRAALPTLVAKEQLGRANGLVEMAPALGTLLAPALAGALLLAFGLAAVLVVDFVTFLAAVGTLMLVRFPQVASEQGRTTIRQEFLDGLRYLRDRRGLFGFLWIAAGLNLVLTLSNVLWVPVFLAFTNEATLGTILSLGGMAMLAGSMAMGAWGGPRRRVRGMLVFMMIGGLALGLAGLRPSVPVATAGVVGLMLVVPIVNGTSQTLWQTKIHPAFQGRVFSTRRMIAQIATPIAFVSAGPLADHVFEPLLAIDGPLTESLGGVFGTGPGRGSGLLVSVAGLAVIALAGLAWVFPAIRNIETDIPDALVDDAPREAPV